MYLVDTRALRLTKAGYGILDYGFTGGRGLVLYWGVVNGGGSTGILVMPVVIGCLVRFVLKRICRRNPRILHLTHHPTWQCGDDIGALRMLPGKITIPSVGVWFLVAYDAFSCCRLVLVSLLLPYSTYIMHTVRSRKYELVCLAEVINAMTKTAPPGSLHSSRYISCGIQP